MGKYEKMINCFTYSSAHCLVAALVINNGDCTLLTDNIDELTSLTLLSFNSPVE